MNEDFGIFAQNSYRTVRTVEMYQWKETRHTRTTGSGSNRRTETYYTHEKLWSENMINSAYFNEKSGHANPNVEFPFKSEKQQADEVTIGLTFLHKESIDQLGWSNVETVKWLEGMEPQVKQACDKAISQNFTPFEMHGDWIYSRPKGWEHSEVGLMRYKYQIHKCGPATVIGQQVQDDRMLMTVRKYNPKKKTVPFGTSTEEELDDYGGRKILCCLCKEADQLVSNGMQSEIHYACDGKKTIQDFLDN